MSDKIPNTQESTKTFNSVEEGLPFIIPRRVMNVLKGSENFFDLMVLFLFYCDIAREQKTNKIYANTELIKQRIKIGIRKIQSLRRELIQLGLIEEIKPRELSGTLKPTCYHLLWDTGT